MAAPPVSVGSVVYDDDDTQYVEDAGPIADYMMHNHYERDGHTYMGGLTSPTPFNGAMVGFVRIGGPTLLWIAEWTACKLGGHPPVPDFNPPSGWVLLDANAVLAMVSVGPSGKDPIYRIDGTYVYGCLNPSANLFSDAEYPQAPWLRDGFTRKVPASSLGTRLLSAGGYSLTTAPTGTTTRGGQGNIPPTGRF